MLNMNAKFFCKQSVNSMIFIKYSMCLIQQSISISHLHAWIISDNLFKTLELLQDNILTCKHRCFRELSDQPNCMTTMVWYHKSPTRSVDVTKFRAPFTNIASLLQDCHLVSYKVGYKSSNLQHASKEGRVWQQGEMLTKQPI